MSSIDDPGRHNGTGPLSSDDGWFDIDTEPAPAPVPARENPGHYRAWLAPADTDTTITAVDAEPAVAEMPSHASHPDARGRRWWILIAGVGCAAIAATVLVFAPFRSPELAPTAVTAGPDSTAITSSAMAVCPPSPGFPEFDGRGAGGMSSGPEVVLALEHGYYVERSAAAVRAVLVADGPFGSDAEIQSGINEIPSGTTHCVQIAAAGPQRWAVTITEHRPAGSTVVLHQVITTTVREDRTLIAAVTPA